MKVKPFQTKGSSFSQIIISEVLNTSAVTVRFKVTNESHPVTRLVSNAVWEPAAEKTNPFQV